MPITYDESAALMQDQAFRGRVKVSCIKFADYILNEPASVPAHNARVRWANGTYQNPDQTSFQVTPPTVMDPAVQEAGSSIDDAGLQSAVENVVNKLI